MLPGRSASGLAGRNRVGQTVRELEAKSQANEVGRRPGTEAVTSTLARIATGGLIALLAAAALDITGRIGQIGPARFTAYQLLALAMTLFAGWLLATRRASWRRTPLDVPLGTFLALSALSLAFATEPGRAAVQLVSLSSSVILALLVVLLVREPRQGAHVVLGSLGVAAAMGLLAVLEWAGVFAVRHPVFFTPGYGIRARVTFEDPNILASFLMGVLLLAVPLLWSAPMTRRARALGWAGAALGLSGLVTTYSRGGIGALIVGLVCVVALARASRRARVAFVAVIVLAVVLAGALVFDARWIAENVLDIRDNGSAMNRVYMVEGALRMWRDHPFGVGLDNYQVVYPEYRDPRAEPGIVESHTAYVTVLAETGFLGLAAFLWVLGSFFVRAAGPAARRSKDPTLQALATGAFAAGAGLCAQAFTYSLEGSKFLWFAIGSGAAAWQMLQTERETAPASECAAKRESSLT